MGMIQVAVGTNWRDSRVLFIYEEKCVSEEEDEAQRLAIAICMLTSFKPRCPEFRRT